MQEPSSFRNEQCLREFLIEQDIPALAGIDTRALTSRLRDKGTLKGYICTTAAYTPEQAIAKAKGWEGLDGQDYASLVSCKNAYEWDTKGTMTCSWGLAETLPPATLKIAAYDFGIKRNILRRMRMHGMDITVYPANTPHEELLKENPGLDAGIHLTLTSEWESLKWRPLTPARSITDEDGYFFPMIWPNENYPKDRALKNSDWKLEEIERELRAQIEMGKKHIAQVSHLTGHMGISSISPEVQKLVEKLAREYDLWIDMSQVSRAGGYQGPKDTPEEKIESFGKTLQNLQSGTYLFVDHPGHDTAEMRGIYHIGYEQVARDREGVTVAWTSEEIKKIIRERQIKLISYADLEN
jgi:hypothetical protein